MATIDGARGANVSRDLSSSSLAAPGSRAPSSKGPESSAVSVASRDSREDDMRTTSDGALDRLRSRTSDDGRSDTSSHRQRMSKLFKGRSKRPKSATSQDDLSQLDPHGDTSGVSYVRRPSAEPRNYSDDSLGLHRSVASSLLTEDSDSEA